jgi:hypothetical protein
VSEVQDGAEDGERRIKSRKPQETKESPDQSRRKPALPWDVSIMANFQNIP